MDPCFFIYSNVGKFNGLIIERYSAFVNLLLVAICSAEKSFRVAQVVVEGAAKPLLGALPMEEMHVIIHPKRYALAGNPDHPPEDYGSYSLAACNQSTKLYADIRKLNVEY